MFRLLRACAALGLVATNNGLLFSGTSSLETLAELFERSGRAHAIRDADGGAGSYGWVSRPVGKPRSCPDAIMAF
jgi:hypothetical protein